MTENIKYKIDTIQKVMERDLLRIEKIMGKDVIEENDEALVRRLRRAIDRSMIEIAELKGQVDVVEKSDIVPKKDDLKNKCVRGRGEEKAQVALLQKFYNYHYNKLAKAGEWDIVRDDPILAAACKGYYEKLKKDKMEKTALFFVTINPSEDKIGLENFVKMVHGFMNRKPFKVVEYYYVFEQQASSVDDDDFGSHYHCHMLIERGEMKPSDFKRNVKSTFKAVIGPKAKEDRVINIKEAGITEFNRIQNYILGYKADDYKKEMCDTDAMWREANKLEHLYYNVNRPPRTELIPRCLLEGDDKTSEEDDDIDEEDIDKGKEVCKENLIDF